MYINIDGSLHNQLIFFFNLSQTGYSKLPYLIFCNLSNTNTVFFSKCSTMKLVGLKFKIVVHVITLTFIKKVLVQESYCDSEECVLFTVDLDVI